MCIFEVLHFLPLALIAAAAFLPKSYKLFSVLTILVMSIVGLSSGQHVHTEHFAEFGSFDYCYMYVATSMYAAYGIAKSIVIKAIKA